jgi:hypothetical protein
MTTLDASSPSPRSTLVAAIRRRLDRQTFPRVIVLAMLVTAGAASFLCSAIALRTGIDSMAVRYPLATASGYIVFLLLIRFWIAVRRGWYPDDIGAGDAIGDLIHVSGRAVGRARHALADTVSDGLEWPFDLDDAWWLALAALAAAAGLVAVASVVYSAPVLLAEVALDAALVGTVYGRLRTEERRYWATTAVRQTWVSAVTLIAFMAVLGVALQRLAPGGVSIGDVIHRLLAR